MQRMPSVIVVHDVDDPATLSAARALAREYAALTHVLGRWVDPDSEIIGLPGPYRAPSGGVLLAVVDGDYVGCVAFAPLDEGAVELKRLYVRPGLRGRGVGLALVRAVVQRARTAGYSCIRLDTAPELGAAVALYLKEGFREIGRYRDDLYADARCFELTLGLRG